MNLRGLSFLGFRYLARNRVKTGLLVLALTLVWLLPAAITLLVDRVEDHLRARAAETPLVLGSAGSPLELVFNALHYSEARVTPMTYGDALALAEEGQAEVIPLNARFSAGEHRIVGTSIDYLRFRGIEVEAGRPFLRLGECVVGAAVAEKNGIAVGDSVISSPETLFDLAGVYPLRMTVCGILAPQTSPDDEAIFVDLKTSWIIEGLGHGHKDADAATQDERIESGDRSDGVRLNASVLEYNEVSADNAASFHFHGEVEDFPITSAIVIPRGAKEQALVKGRFAGDEARQLISPAEVMEELFATVFSVKRAVLGLLLLVGIATVALGLLTFALSNRLRRKEFDSLSYLGASPAMVRALVGFEAVFVLGASLLLSALLLLGVHLLAPLVLARWLG